MSNDEKAGTICFLVFLRLECVARSHEGVTPLPLIWSTSSTDQVLAINRSSYKNRGALYTEHATMMRCMRSDQTSQTVRAHGHLFSQEASGRHIQRPANLEVLGRVLLRVY